MAFAASVFSVESHAADPTFTTLAGSGTAGSADGTGAGAQFFAPNGVAVDLAGFVYVADYANHIVRKISPQGETSTLAGKARESGSVDGPASAARFSYPTAVAVDSAGNVFVADNSSVIRKISTAGEVTTIAGKAGFTTYADGVGAAARFNTPSGLAVDSSGVIYVADQNNHCVRKIAPDGTVTTLAGKPGEWGSQDGFVAAARFNGPSGVAVDGSGNIYVSETYNVTVRKISTDGQVSTLAGTAGNKGGADGIGAAAQFFDPQGITVDSAGNLYVADSGDAGNNYTPSSPGHTIRKISPQGVVSTIGGLSAQPGYTEGAGTAARFSSPADIAVDSAGNIYVADSGNHAIRKGASGGRILPRISWADPAPIFANNPLSSVQLNATANVPGTFSYSPDFGALLTPGTHQLSVTFYPNDPIVYATASAQVTLVVQTPLSAKLVNIATRGYCSTADRVMIAGFVISGSVPKTVLIRAVGPSLTSRGIGSSDVLADPIIEVHQGAPVIASNDNWTENSNAAELASVGAQIGAAPLETSDSKSAVLLLKLQPGVYTFVANGKGGASGVVLLEVYDAETATTGSNFVNIATRAYSTTGNGVTIGGFVISGNSAKQVLLRAVGPSLGVRGIAQADVLADPMIELHDASHGNAVIATNDNWGDNTNAGSITTMGARIGAAPFDASDTKSSALLTTLQPGAYTFIASGKSGTSGIVLVEVYDAD